MTNRNERADKVMHEHGLEIKKLCDGTLRELDRVLRALLAQMEKGTGILSEPAVKKLLALLDGKEPTK